MGLRCNRLVAAFNELVAAYKEPAAFDNELVNLRATGHASSQIDEFIVATYEFVVSCDEGVVVTIYSCAGSSSLVLTFAAAGLNLTPKH